MGMVTFHLFMRLSHDHQLRVGTAAGGQQEHDVRCAILAQFWRNSAQVF